MRNNIISLILIVASCSEKKSDKELKNIDIAGALGKGRIISLSEIASDVTYIPLETNDSSLIGNINLILYEGGQIYIVHNSTTISVFDNTGNFTLMNQPVKGKQGFKDDLEGGPVFWPKSVSSQEYIIAAHTAISFKDFAENQKCSKKIKELAAGINESGKPRNCNS